MDSALDVARKEETLKVGGVKDVRIEPLSPLGDVKENHDSCK